MPSLMSFSHTAEQIINRTKTVTRRLGWRMLRPGQRVWAVEKAMGLRKGEKVKRLALLEIVSVTREPVGDILARCYERPDEIAKEGFPDMGETTFLMLFAKINNLRGAIVFDLTKNPPHFGARWENLEITRIEFKYVDE